jgi:hypothetical protein
VAFVLFYTAWNGAAVIYVIVRGAKKPPNGSGGPTLLRGT